MKLGDGLRKLLNGGAAAAGVQGLEAEITGLLQKQKAAREELNANTFLRAKLLLADDDAALDKLDVRDGELYRDLEKIQIALPKLQAKVVELRGARRKDRIKFHQDQLAAVSVKLNAAIDAALECNEQAVKTFEAACSEIGNDHTLPRIHFPGMLNRDSVEFWRRDLRNVFAALSGAAVSPPGVAPRQGYPNYAAQSRHGTSIISAPKKPAPAPTPRPAPFQVKAPRALPDVVPAGYVRMRVMRAGYTDAKGVQLDRGDLVDVLKDVAPIAAGNGGVEYLPPQPPRSST
jgi:hypothetical protein